LRLLSLYYYRRLSDSCIAGHEWWHGVNPAADAGDTSPIFWLWGRQRKCPPPQYYYVLSDGTSEFIKICHFEITKQKDCPSHPQRRPMPRGEVRTLAEVTGSSRLGLIDFSCLFYILHDDVSHSRHLCSPLGLFTKRRPYDRAQNNVESGLVPYSPYSALRPPSPELALTPLWDWQY